MCSFLIANWLILNLTQVNFFLQPRGPDGTNRWQGYGFDFVHNLLHMTGERTFQPFHDPDSDVVALFNGEVYNWKDLQGSEQEFRSDGEALIHQYLRVGPTFPRTLDGEFALALFDFKRGRMVLATDTFGTKPLWFGMGPEGRFAVATYRSALEHILPRGDSEVRRIEPNAVMIFDISTAAVEEEPGSSGHLGPPQLVSQVATFEFDLRQHKSHTRDWATAFLASVRKRSRGANYVALCLSDGYDTGAIALALVKLRVPHALYTVQAKEDVRILAARLGFLERRGVAATLRLGRLSVPDFARERAFLGERAERVQYRMREGYANVDDKAAAGLSWVFRQAAAFGHRLFLSGSGADETISDYGMYGRPLEFHSTLMGIFPEHLAESFPWLNFLLGTQLDYLAKEEATAGAHGVETRYPFLDRAVVQEYLWLDARVKNAVYKAPISELMREAGYPFTPDGKRGFSADKNLVGGEAEERSSANDAAIDAGDQFWAQASILATSSDVDKDSGACEEGSTLIAFVDARHSAEDTDRKPHLSAGSEGAPAPSPCVIRLTVGQMLDIAGSARQQDVPADAASQPTSEAWRKQISRLPAILRVAAAEEQDELAPTLSLAAASGLSPRHRAVFLTSCMEEEYFWTYCAPFVSSFGEAFGLEDADHDRLAAGHWMLIATVGVASTYINYVHSRYPFAQFMSLDEDLEKLSQHEDPTEAENYRRKTYQALKLRQYVRLWQEEVFNSGVDFVVCLDSDMLVVKPFDYIFEVLAQKRVDVAFTYYDGKREVPWGTAEELSTTKGEGYVRLQGGMLLMRNAIEALHWFAIWTDLTKTMLHEVESGGPQSERWEALYKEFKGPSQAALAFLLTQGQLEQMKHQEVCCSSVRRVMLEALRPGEPDVEVRMWGLPARFLNDAESTEDGRLPTSVHVVHLKGHWWRAVLPEGLEHIVVPTRSYEWNREAFELWRRHFKKFPAGDVFLDT